MKKRIIVALTVVIALGLAMAVYALNQNYTSTHNPTADSCPMKDKHASGQTTACCDNDNCCCKTGNCPMNKHSEMASMENCPMKKKDEKQTVSAEMQNVTFVSDDKNCCNCCDCCKG